MNYLRNRAVAITALCAAFFASSIKLSAADEKPGAPRAAKPDVPQVVKLTLHPAKPPAEALQYPLLPRFIDLNSSNAATLYTKAIIFMSDRKEPDEFWDRIGEWSELPPEKLPRGEARDRLARYDAVFDMIRMAAHRDHCDWQPPIRETENVFGILLPEMSPLRKIAQLLALKARLEIAEGQSAKALKTLQTGYALARHTGDCPFLVASLVGIAISAKMDQQLETMIQSPDCPNLYWSLTALPEPIVDLRPALDFESDAFIFAFPELRDIGHARHSPEEWESIFVGFVRRYAPVMDFPNGQSLDNIGATALMTARGFSMLAQAKADLVAAGRDQKEVDVMPATQAILLHTVLIYKRARDETFKGFNLPYWQARERFIAFDQRLGTEIRQQEIIPVASLLLPALGKVRTASVRGERRIALLRMVEALRFYAADHDGQLPAALDDVKEVPLPLDPVTGKPFGYSIADGKATLDAPPPVGERWDALGTRYEITIAARK